MQLAQNEFFDVISYYLRFTDEDILATQDALGFQDNMFPILAGLAVIIGMQGFSYLYDRKKVDLYHSVPVDKMLNR